MSLVLPTLRLAYRRVFGGMATARSRAVRAAATGAVVCLIEGLAIAEARRQTAATEALSAFVPPLAAIMVYLASGSIILLSVSARDSSGSIRGVLATLPFSKTGAVLLEWIPVLTTALILLGLAVTPAATALISARYPPSAAVALIVAALAAGAGTAGLILSGVALALRASTWNSVRYPLSMLAWAAVAATAIWRSFAQSKSAYSSPGDLALGLPPVVRQAGFGGTIEPWVAAIAALGGLLVVGFLVPWSLAGQLTGRRRRIGWSWKGGPPSLTLGELVYSTRNATLVANAVAAEVLVVGLCILLAAVPAPMRQPLLAPILIVAACLVGSVVRQQRSQFPVRRPPQQLINLDSVPWVARQLGIGLLWFSALYAPVVAAALWIGLPPGTAWGTWAAAGASAFAVSALSGWLFPLPLDNAPGQLLASVATVAAAGTASAFTVEVSSTSPWLALTLSLGTLVLCAGTAVAVERHRWAALDVSKAGKGNQGGQT